MSEIYMILSASCGYFIPKELLLSSIQNDGILHYEPDQRFDYVAYSTRQAVIYVMLDGACIMSTPLFPFQKTTIFSDFGISCLP